MAITIYDTYVMESGGIVRLQDARGAAFECSATEFATYEPAYPVLVAPYLSRRWTEETQCVSDGISQTADPAYTYPLYNQMIRRVTAYQTAYDAAHPPVVTPPPPTEPETPPEPEMPTIYATLTLSGGDGKTPLGLKLGHASNGVMDISGDLRATPETSSLPISVSTSWRITVRKVISEYCTTTIDSYTVEGLTIANNVISWTGFNPAALGMSPGVYMITDEDFDTISGAAYGFASDYKVSLIGGKKFFKVYA